MFNIMLQIYQHMHFNKVICEKIIFVHLLVNDNQLHALFSIKN